MVEGKTRGHHHQEFYRLRKIIMAAPACVHLPLHFMARQEVRGFIIRASKLEMPPMHATAAAFLIVLDFATQGRDWRPLRNDWRADAADWPEEPLAVAICHAACSPAHINLIMSAALQSDLLRLEVRADVPGLACPIFGEYNEHLLPGYESFHVKGQKAQQKKREAAADPEIAQAQRRILQGSLDFGELSEGTTDAEIEAAIILIAQMDRAAGLGLRSIKQYATWMLAAAVRFSRESNPAEIARLIEFLFEARMDPTVPKGAEVVLTRLPELLERSRH